MIQTSSCPQSCPCPKKITFQTEDLGTEATLLLIFGKHASMTEIKSEYFPIVWKVKTFPAEGCGAMEVTYTSQQAFIKPRVDSEDEVVSAKAFVAIDAGQQTDLARARETFFFSEPSKGPIRPAILARNLTGSTEDLSIGFMGSENRPVPTIYFPEFFKGAEWGFSGVETLYAYITSDYKEMQVLKGDIEDEPIWQQKLADINCGSTTWTLTQDPTGKYNITKVQKDCKTSTSV